MSSGKWNHVFMLEASEPQATDREEIADQEAGTVVFPKALLQVHLTEASSKLLVLNTHKGRYRLKKCSLVPKCISDENGHSNCKVLE